MDLRNTLLLAVAGSALSTGVVAQERLAPPEFQLSAGARVRMSVEGARVEGYLSGREGDSLRLALPGQNPFALEVAIPLSAATRVELHVGQKRHTKIGALLGAVVMGLTGFWDPVDSESCQQSSTAMCSRAEAVAISALAGAALGAIVGHAIKTDQWAPVPPEALAMIPPTANEIRQAPGGSRIPVGRAIPAAVSVRF